MQVNGHSNAKSHFLLLLQNRQPDSLQTWWQCTFGGCLRSLYKWSCSSDFCIFCEFFCSFLGANLKKSSSLKPLTQLLWYHTEILLGAPSSEFVHQVALQSFSILSWLFGCFHYFWLLLQNHDSDWAETWWIAFLWKVQAKLYTRWQCCGFLIFKDFFNSGTFG